MQICEFKAETRYVDVITGVDIKSEVRFQIQNATCD